jgi:murein DD-endopeptidase MepM/ murein hydrolase activator NlpD
MKNSPFKSPKSIFSSSKKKKNKPQGGATSASDAPERVNKTVYLTVAVLLIVLAVAVAMTSAANRARKPSPSDTTTPSTTQKPTITTSPDTEKNPPDTTPPAPDTTPPTPSTDAPAVNVVPTLALPTEGYLGNEHDPTVQIYSNTLGEWRVHLGIDIVTQAGAPVYAAANGVVSDILDDPLWGKCVFIKHDGDAVTVYRSLSDELASGITTGARVVEGQMLGAVGEGGITELADEPHLHFEFMVNGQDVDPLEYFSKSALGALKSASDTEYEN